MAFELKVQKPKVQKPDEIVDISNWRDHGFSVYPEGKRDKILISIPYYQGNKEHKGHLVSPPSHLDIIARRPQNILDIKRYPFLKRGWSYLFKYSKESAPHQFWMEIFAYQFGCLIDVSVPATFVAVDQAGMVGSFSEWFYTPYEPINTPGTLPQELSGSLAQNSTDSLPQESTGSLNKALEEISDRYIPGGNILQSDDENFDRKKGRKHNFLDVVRLLSGIHNLKLTWKTDLAKIFTFDALIGNTDRHQENWGVIESSIEASKNNINILGSHLAPAFDNGDSMGYEILETKMDEYDIERLDNYINKGKPHIKWNVDEEYKNRSNHEILLKKIMDSDTALREPIVACLNFTDTQIYSILERLQSFDIEPRLTEKRAEFMLKLMSLRRERLRSLFV